jgi:hypothetical protein
MSQINAILAVPMHFQTYEKIVCTFDGSTYYILPMMKTMTFAAKIALT